MIDRCNGKELFLPAQCGRLGAVGVVERSGAIAGHERKLGIGGGGGDGGKFLVVF